MLPQRCCLLLITALLGLAAAGSTAPAAPADNPLVQAAWDGNSRQVKILLDGGVDINAIGPGRETALVAAADQNHPEIVQLLLDRHANVNLAADDGLTALIAESAAPNISLVERLLAMGANPNARRDSAFRSNTPLQGAVEFGGPKIVRLLVEHGANVNAVNGDGRSPLMEVGFQGDAESVRLLLAHKATVNVHDFFGNTALSQAAEGPPMDRPRPSNLGVIKMLVTAGADWRKRGPQGENSIDASRRLGTC